MDRFDQSRFRTGYRLDLDTFKNLGFPEELFKEGLVYRTTLNTSIDQKPTHYSQSQYTNPVLEGICENIPSEGRFVTFSGLTNYLFSEEERQMILNDVFYAVLGRENRTSFFALMSSLLSKYSQREKPLGESDPHDFIYMPIDGEPLKLSLDGALINLRWGTKFFAISLELLLDKSNPELILSTPKELIEFYQKLGFRIS